MLIMELFSGPILQEDNEDMSANLQQAVNDILLRAKAGGIEKIGLADLAAELNYSVKIFIDPNNPEFRQQLIDVVQQNDWVTGISGDDEIQIANQDDIQPNTGGEAGDEIEQARANQETKVQKIAAKNVRDGGSKNEL